MIGKNVEFYRKLQNLSQRKLADKLGVSNTYISQIENGKSVPNDEMISRLSKELKVSIDELKKDIDRNRFPCLYLINEIMRLTELGYINWTIGDKEYITKPIPSDSKLLNYLGIEHQEIYSFTPCFYKTLINDKEYIIGAEEEKGYILLVNSIEVLLNCEENIDAQLNNLIYLASSQLRRNNIINDLINDLQYLEDKKEED